MIENSNQLELTASQLHVVCFLNSIKHLDISLVSSPYHKTADLENNEWNMGPLQRLSKLWNVIMIACKDYNISFACGGYRITAFPGPPTPNTLHAFSTPIRNPIDDPDAARYPGNRVAHGMEPIGRFSNAQALHDYLGLLETNLCKWLGTQWLSCVLLMRYRIQCFRLVIAAIIRIHIHVCNVWESNNAIDWD